MINANSGNHKKYKISRNIELRINLQFKDRQTIEFMRQDSCHFSNIKRINLIYYAIINCAWKIWIRFFCVLPPAHPFAINKKR